MSQQTVTIEGEKVTLQWDQQTARSYAYRASKIGGAPTMKDLTNPKRADAATTDLLWLLLPPKVAERYRNPEELYLAIDHEKDAAEIHSAVASIIMDMVADSQKKMSSTKSPSPESNSG